MNKATIRSSLCIMVKERVNSYRYSTSWILCLYRQHWATTIRARCASTPVSLSVYWTATHVVWGSLSIRTSKETVHMFTQSFWSGITKCFRLFASILIWCENNYYIISLRILYIHKLESCVSILGNSRYYIYGSCNPLFYGLYSLLHVIHICEGYMQ